MDSSKTGLFLLALLIAILTIASPVRTIYAATGMDAKAQPVQYVYREYDRDYYPAWRDWDRDDWRAYRDWDRDDWRWRRWRDWDRDDWRWRGGRDYYNPGYTYYYWDRY